MSRIYELWKLLFLFLLTRCSGRTFKYFMLREYEQFLRVYHRKLYRQEEK
jgi:hypothetical protein